MKVFLVVVLLLVLVGGGYYLYNNKQAEVQTPTTNTTIMKDDTKMEPSRAPSSATSESMKETDGIKEFTVEGKNFSFSPSTITVNKGDKVKLTFKNSDGYHNLVIDELNVKTQSIQSGSDDSVTFTADKAGTFEYYCSIANHRAMGMKGTLTVK